MAIEVFINYDKVEVTTLEELVEALRKPSQFFDYMAVELVEPIDNEHNGVLMFNGRDYGDMTGPLD
jgi:hypothetical protein